MNRLLATLVIVALFIVAVVALAILMAPIIVRSSPISSSIFRVMSASCSPSTADPSRPWLSKIIGEGLGHAEESIGKLTLCGGLARHLPALGVVGRPGADLGVLWRSTPIVACYLIYDWRR